MKYEKQERKIMKIVYKKANVCHELSTLTSIIV